MLHINTLASSPDHSQFSMLHTRKGEKTSIGLGQGYDNMQSHPSGALRHGIQFSRKNYARGGHITRFYVNGRGITYIHNDTSMSAHC